MKKVIAGSELNLDHPDFKAAKSVVDLKKLEIFSHLGADAQTAAHKELWDALHPPIEKSIS